MVRVGTGRKKIEIKRKEKASDRMVTFSKRRKGLFKKITELHSKTAAKAAVVVFSPAGNPYTHGEPSFDSVLSDYFKMMGHPDEIVNVCNNGTTGSDNEGDAAAAGVDRNPAEQWLDSLQVDECESLEEAMAMLNKLEEIATQVQNRDFVSSLFV